MRARSEWAKWQCPNYGSSGGGYVAQARTDGYTYGTYTFQGVRIFDSNSSQWLSPDADAGDVRDPMSQKPFMWIGNNPFSYSDPSGYYVFDNGSSSEQKQFTEAAQSLDRGVVEKMSTIKDKPQRAVENVPGVGS